MQNEGHIRPARDSIADAVLCKPGTRHTIVHGRATPLGIHPAKGRGRRRRMADAFEDEGAAQKIGARCL